jgi:heat-inducible transcriptional repressor
LLERPEFIGEGRLGVMSALDEHERIVALLGATLAANGTAVVVGGEAGELAGGQLSIVGAPFRERGRTAGTVGVIGPTRMDYAKVVPIVAATAEAMTAYMGRQGLRDADMEEPSPPPRDGDPDKTRTK